MALKAGANLDFENTAKPINVPDPTDNDDLATKGYVDRRRAYYLPAGSLLVPGTGWNYTTPAPTSADSTDTQMLVVRFDDTTSESRGWQCYIPAGATTMAIDWLIRAQTGPAGTRTVRVDLAYQRYGTNGATPSWATHNVGDLSIPANAYWQTLTQTLLLTDPTTDLVAGSDYLMQVQLNGTPGSGTKLTGDRTVAAIGVRFY